MYINVNNLVRVNIVNPPDSHKTNLANEFHFIKKQLPLDNNEEIQVIFKSNLKFNRKQAVDVSAPIGYDKDGVFWYDPSDRIARIDFAGFSSTTTTIICDYNFNRHFLFKIIEYLLSAKLIQKDGIYIHASAVRYKGKTILFPAWRHVGKTNLMLQMIRSGAEFIADDGVFLFKDGYILPYSKQVHLLYFNIASFPELLKYLDPGMIKLMKFIRNSRKGLYQVNTDLITKMQKMIRVRIKKDNLFSENQTVGLPSTGTSIANEDNPVSLKLDAVFYLSKNFIENNNTLPDMFLNQLTLESLVTKNTAITMFEQSHLHTAYRAYAFITGTKEELLHEFELRTHEIANVGFGNIKELFEICFDNHLDNDKATKLILRSL